MSFLTKISKPIKKASKYILKSKPIKIGSSIALGTLIASNAFATNKTQIEQYAKLKLQQPIKKEFKLDSTPETIKKFGLGAMILNSPDNQKILKFTKKNQLASTSIDLASKLDKNGKINSKKIQKNTKGYSLLWEDSNQDQKAQIDEFSLINSTNHNNLTNNLTKNLNQISKQLKNYDTSQTKSKNLETTTQTNNIIEKDIIQENIIEEDITEKNTKTLTENLETTTQLLEKQNITNQTQDEIITPGGNILRYNKTNLEQTLQTIEQEYSNLTTFETIGNQKTQLFNKSGQINKKVKNKLIENLKDESTNITKISSNKSDKILNGCLEYEIDNTKTLTENLNEVVQLFNLSTNYQLEIDKKKINLFENQKINPKLINKLEKKIKNQKTEQFQLSDPNLELKKKSNLKKKATKNLETKIYENICDINSNGIPENVEITNNNKTITIYEKGQHGSQYHKLSKKELKKKDKKNFIGEKAQVYTNEKGEIFYTHFNEKNFTQGLTKIASWISDANLGRQLETKKGQLKTTKDQISNYYLITNSKLNLDNMMQFFINEFLTKYKNSDQTLAFSQRNSDRFIDNLAYIKALNSIITNPANLNKQTNKLTQQTKNKIKQYYKLSKAPTKHKTTDLIHKITTNYPWNWFKKETEKNSKSSKSLYKKSLNTLGDYTEFITNFINPTSISRLDNWNYKNIIPRKHIHPSTSNIQKPIFLKDGTKTKTIGYKADKNAYIIHQTGKPDKICSMTDQNYLKYLEHSGYKQYKKLTNSYLNLINQQFGQKTPQQVDPKYYKIKLQNFTFK